MNICQNLSFEWLLSKVSLLSKEIFFFYQGFLSQTLTIHRTAVEGRGPSFIPHYHFHLLTNIQTFICNFGCEMTIKYLQSQGLCLPGCYSMRFTTLLNHHLIDWLIDWWCNVCLFTWWIDSRFLLQRFDMGNWWIWTCIDYHPCITSEPTNQVYIEGIETMFCLWSFLIFFTKQPMTKRLQKY